MATLILFARILLFILIKITWKKNDPNWIVLPSIFAPGEGDYEKKKVKGELACYCDFHKASYFRKLHDSATCNSKKRLETALEGNEVTSQENLASIATQQENQMWYNVNMHAHSHAHICSNDSLDNEPLTED